MTTSQKSTSSTADSGAASLVASGYEAADAASDCLSLALEYENRDRSVWRLLAAIHLGRGRTAEYSSLVARYEESFQEKFRLESTVEQDTDHSSIFPLPAKIDDGNVPEFIVIRAACAGAARAVLDFTRVRRASAGGLVDLTKLLKRLARESSRPELRGIEPFISSVESVSMSDTGSPEMWDLLFVYRRYLEDPQGFEDTALRYAERFGISPPSW
jgi:anti-anti-sigma regulatory factor